jgi:hypothetical protein
MDGGGSNRMMHRKTPAEEVYLKYRAELRKVIVANIDVSDDPGRGI